MAVFQPFPRLYEQPSGTTQNYYGGLGRTPVTGTYAGNQNPGALSRTSVEAPNTTMPLNQTPTPTPQPITPPANRPSYGTLGLQGDGSMGSYADVLTPEDWAKLNGRYLAGNAYDNGLIIDPSQLEYDERLGWITGKDNIREDNSGLFRYGRLGNIALGVGAVLGGAGISSALGAGAFPTVAAPDMAMPTLTGAAEGTLAAAPSLSAEAALGGASVPTANSLANYGTMTTGPDGESVAGPIARGGAEAATGGPGTSALARTAIRGGLGLLQTVGNRNNVNATADQIRRDAEAANPWGPYRPEYAQRLAAAYRDPTAMMNLLQQTPGYQFTRQQGEQAIERQSAKQGYFRSPNMLYDLSKFNQNLASTTWDKEIQRIMTMAGVNINPDSQLNANNQANLLRGQGNASNWANIAAILGDDDMMSLGSDFYDWLSSFVG